MGPLGSTLSKWASSDRSPSSESMRRIGEFCEVEPGHLHPMTFVDLLAHDLSGPERFNRVEQKIAARLDRAGTGKTVQVQCRHQRAAGQVP